MGKEYPHYRDRIVVDPHIMVGKPVVRGTRIPVELVLKRMAQNPNVEELLEAYPRLTVEDVKACPEYAQGGYAPLNLPELIETLRPQVVLISLSADNRDSLPNQETLEAVEGYRLQHTDLNSWLRLSTVGT